MPSATVAGWSSEAALGEVLFARTTYQVWKIFLRTDKYGKTAYETVEAANEGLSFVDFTRLSWRFAHRKKHLSTYKGDEAVIDDGAYTMTHASKALQDGDPDYIGEKCSLLLSS